MLQFFQNLRIGARLAISFGLIALLIVAMAVLNAVETAKVRDLATEVSHAQAERMSLTREWHKNIEINSMRTLVIGFSTDSNLAAYFADDVKRVTARTTEVQKRFGELETTPKGIEAVEKLGEKRKLYLVQRDAILKADAAGDDAAARAMVVKFKPIVEDYVGAAKDLIAFEDARNQEMGEQVTAAMRMTEITNFVVTGACVVASLLLGWALNRSIVLPLSRAQQTAERVADGDLSVDLKSTSTDEVGRLTDSLAKMQTSLRTLVGEIRLSVDSIGVASSEVAIGNQDLSARTEQSAASLQQTASSVEQIASTVRQSADSARQANQLAVQASEIANQGGNAVASVATTMDAIQVSSHKISDIIGVIDGIAFQTNILALNAAVEAARAGEDGRGFAVVASEVRSLAQRSATAAKEIKSLINESVERVEAGAKQAKSAGQTLIEVVASVQRVSDIVGEIAVAAKEQNEGIAEINRAVSNLDQATQQNAALVEESAAAAASLKDQASVLAKSVQTFRLSAS